MKPTKVQRRNHASAAAWTSLAAKAAEVVFSVLAGVALSACASNASPSASLSRSVTVDASPAAVWSAIGPYCAIKDWLPPIGTCVVDGKSPPTRTLVTKDGAATFVELQTARDDARRFYSYTFRSSPLPVSHYFSTIAVTPNGAGTSTVTWSSTYAPVPGKEAEASAALTGVYDAGLTSIKTRFAQN